MNYKPEQIRRYFEARFQGQRMGSGPELKLRCPFHQDRTPSFSLNIEKGVWACFAGCGKGGMLLFEQKFSACDENTAKANIAELCGVPQSAFQMQKPEAVYQYHDATGRLVFEKLRYPGKRFVQRKPNGKGGYDYKLGDGNRPLYRLPEVLTANLIAVCEGEKDADNLRAAMANVTLPEDARFAATCNFDGAGKWRDHYAPFFAGKCVAVFADNDEPGRKHAQQVATSIHRLAAIVKVVNLPDLPEKGDVSDYLKNHTPADLWEQVKATRRWFPPEQAHSGLLVNAPTFVTTLPQEIDWLVHGIIERKANGFFCAVPKGGKSWAAIDLALSLALGAPWLGFEVSKPVRTALISREDNPALTSWRLQHLFAKKEGGNRDLITTHLYVNSRQQSPELMIDDHAQMGELTDALKRLEIEFAIFDVLNVLHAADENDNTEMRAVLRRLSALQAEVGCGIGVVHHYSKAENGSMTQRLRGASAIAGWAEWLIGISMADEESKTRRMEFELKAAQPPDPIFYRIESSPGLASLVRTEQPCGQHQPREGSAAERLIRR